MNIGLKNKFIVALLFFIVAGMFSGFHFDFTFASDGHDMEMNQDCADGYLCPEQPANCIDYCISKVVSQNIESGVLTISGADVEVDEPEVELLLELAGRSPTLGIFDELPKPGIDNLLTTQKRE